jgi:hypothetical protein
MVNRIVFEDTDLFLSGDGSTLPKVKLMKYGDGAVSIRIDTTNSPVTVTDVILNKETINRMAHWLIAEFDMFERTALE